MAAKISNLLGTRSHRSHLSGTLVVDKARVTLPSFEVSPSRQWMHPMACLHFSVQLPSLETRVTYGYLKCSLNGLVDHHCFHFLSELRKIGKGWCDEHLLSLLPTFFIMHVAWWMTPDAWCWKVPEVPKVKKVSKVKKKSPESPGSPQSPCLVN